jgi:DNA-binding LacI/PurR family transcriptional regulator
MSEATPPPSTPPQMPLRRAPTSTDVARLAGVSQAAVSVVLRGKEGKISVSAPVRERILQAAATLDYRPSRSARTMRSQHTNTIGFISTNYLADADRLINHVIHPFIVGLNRRLTQDNFHTVLIELNELEVADGLPPALRERFFDALVVHIGLSPRALATLRGSGLPMLYFDSGVFEPERCIYRDERSVGRAAAELLLDAGHRRIAFFHLGRHWRHLQELEHKMDHFSYRFRLDGFEEAIRARGLEPLHLVHDGSPQELARRIRDERITGIVVGGGSRLPGPLIRALLLAERRVPEDVSLVSCDIEKRLTREEFEMGGVFYDRFGSGALAAEQILQLVNDPRASVPSRVLPIETIQGDTIAPPPFS